MSRCALALGFICALFSARTAGAAERITLWTTSDGCPSGDLVRRQLQPLIEGRPIDLVGSEPALAVVRDEGKSYSVVVADAVRQVVDGTRNCLERARVAAVFIAMNLPPEARAEPPPPAQLSPERPESPPVPQPTPERPSRVGVQGRFETAFSPEYEVTSLGVSVGPSFSWGRWELALLFGFSGPTTLSGLGPSSESVELLRFPARLTLAHLWTVGSVGLGPELGVFAGVTRIRGDQVPEPETSVRFDGGGSAGLVLRWRPRERFAVGLQANFLFSPYRYDLVVGPDRTLGQTPATWLLGGISLAYTF